jgi:Tfp pilus assembly protein PilX
MIDLDLDFNGAEALLRHAEGHIPNTGAREDPRLADALANLVEAINRLFKRMESSSKYA